MHAAPPNLSPGPRTRSSPAHLHVYGTCAIATCLENSLTQSVAFSLSCLEAAKNPLLESLAFCRASYQNTCTSSESGHTVTLHRQAATQVVYALATVV
jgi:hypothetical protein